MSEKEVKEVVDVISEDKLFGLGELHPLDFEKERDLAQRLRREDSSEETRNWGFESEK